MENYYMVIKRNGTPEPFIPGRIREAICKTVIASLTQDELKNFSNQVLEKLTSDVVIQIKDIFDKQIKDILDKQTDYPLSIKSVGIKNYSKYRRKRDEIRSTRDSISKTISDVLMSDSKDSDTKRDEIIDAIGRGNTTSIKSFERFDAKDNKRR